MRARARARVRLRVRVRVKVRVRVRVKVRVRVRVKVRVRVRVRVRGTCTCHSLLSGVGCRNVPSDCGAGCRCRAVRCGLVLGPVLDRRVPAVVACAFAADR